MTVSRNRLDSRTGFGAFVGWSYAVGNRTTAGTSIEHASDRSVVAIDAHRSLPTGHGYGYRVRAEGGGSSLVDGNLQYQSAVGRYELRQSLVAGRPLTSAIASGSIVAIGGRIFAARPVEQSFALVRVPGVSRVRTYVSNQEIGRTDARGNLLVPNLLPYYANRVSIDDTEVPIAMTVSARELVLAPPYRGGAVVLFPVSRDIRASGTIVIDDLHGARRVPAFGTLRVHAGVREIESPVGAGGEFYVEGVPPGAHETTVEDGSGRCTFTLTVPESTAAVVKLGEVACLAQ